MKRLFCYAEAEEWVKLIDTVYITFLKSPEAKQLDEWDYQKVIMLYRATERAYNKADKKKSEKLMKKYKEVTETT
jgi:hypothetical protein